MSFERRNELIDAAGEGIIPKGKICHSIPESLRTGNWDLAAYSYQCSFDAMWDYACTQSNGLSGHALLMICRQSIELSMKSALAITTRKEPTPGHNLMAIFNDLLKARQEIGVLESDDDEHTAMVLKEVKAFHDLDPTGDRFRYPSMKNGRPYIDVSPNMDRLYVAHSLITGWCDAAGIEAEYYNIYIRQP